MNANAHGKSMYRGYASGRCVELIVFYLNLEFLNRRDHRFRPFPDFFTADSWAASRKSIVHANAHGKSMYRGYAPRHGSELIVCFSS